MTEMDWFGHWGYFFLMAGQYFIGCKERMGWLIRLFGEVLWVTIGMSIGMSSIWTWGLVFMAVDIYNFRKWHAEEKATLAEAHWIAEAEDYLEELLNPEKHVAEPLSGQEIRDELGITDEELEIAQKAINETKQRKGKGKNLAAKRRKGSKGNVQPTTRRRSKPANGKRRSRPNAKPRSAKKTRRNV